MAAGYRVNYRGAVLLAGNQRLFRVTAFGSTSTLSNEDIFELSNPNIVGTVKDVSEVSITIDTNENGTIHNLKALSGGNVTGDDINLAQDFETAVVDIRNWMRPTDASSTHYILEHVPDAVLTGYSVNYTLDGNATESFSLTSDRKQYSYQATGPAGHDMGDPEPTQIATRRAYVDVYVFDKPASGIWHSGSGTRLGLQSVSIDATLDRENIGELGKMAYTHKPLNLPISVNVSLEMTFKDLVALGLFSNDTYNIDRFLNSKGICVVVYDKPDTEADRKVVKEIHVPYLIPTDEAFNLSLDGNATHTISFRSHELGITAEPKITV